MALVGALAATVPAQAVRQKATTVRGGWINEPPFCDPRGSEVGPGTPPESVSFSCVAVSPVTGGWTGHNVERVEGTLYSNGDVTGTADAWFYGIYTADKTYGGIHFRGTFSIDGATGAFEEEAQIIGGTCAFAGSSGTISFFGYQLYGGYVAEWFRPANASTEPCNPIVDPPVQSDGHTVPMTDGFGGNVIGASNSGAELAPEATRRRISKHSAHIGRMGDVPSGV